MLLFILGACALSLSFGCSQNAAPPAEKAASTEKGHDHDHAEHGPHDGDLVELGNGEFHGEVVIDEASNDVTIYILDGAAKSAIPVDAKEVTINAKKDGKPQTFTLPAQPQEGDGEGKSSRFVTKGAADLHEALEDEHADARLQVTIAGKPCSGKASHSHDHDHGHDHDDHK